MREADIRLLMEISPDNQLLPGWQRGVERQRTRTIKAGPLLYCASYPIWDTSARRDAEARLAGAREKKGTTEAQRKLNARRAEDRLVQIINANFGAGDHLVTCTYASGKEPDSMEEAQKHMRNYIARVKRLCRRRGVADPAYVYVTEVTTSNRWGTRYHHHMVLRAELPRADVEELWTRHHGICNTRCAKRMREGLTGWAKYIAKQVCAGSRADEYDRRHRWAASKGLKVPVPTEADKKISRRRVEKIAQEIQRDRDVACMHLAACYPGYEVLEMQVKTSEWVGGAYIYAVLAEKDKGGLSWSTTSS
ncbi:MAG: hypothetical protein ACI4WX_11820 [Aristaeellaceae bacterium]